MNKKSYKFLCVILLGLVFIIVSSINIPKVKGLQQTIEDNSAVMDSVYAYPGDQIFITFEVISGPAIDVYILDKKPFLLFGPPTSNVVAQEVNSLSGSLNYTVSKLDYHYIMFLNDGGSSITVELTVFHSPTGLVNIIIMTSITLSIIISIIIISIIIIVLIRQKTKSKNELEFKKRSLNINNNNKKSQLNESNNPEIISKDLKNPDDINWKKKKKKEKELRDIKSKNPKLDIPDFY